MTNRRSPSNRGPRGHGRPASTTQAADSATVQSNVTQFFTPHPGTSTAPQSSSRGSSAQISSPSAGQRAPSTSSSPHGNRRSARLSTLSGSSGRSTTMTRTTPLPREDPADPILDSSPTSYADAAIRPPRSPPSRGAHGANAATVSGSGPSNSTTGSRSPSTRSTRRSAVQVSSPGSSSPARSPGVSHPGGRQGGRGSFRNATGRGGRGHFSQRNNRSESSDDVPMAEARLVSDSAHTPGAAAPPTASPVVADVRMEDSVLPSQLGASTTRRRSSVSTPSTTTLASPSRGSFRDQLDAEVQSLQARSRQEDLASGVEAATAPPVDETATMGDIADDATVATDNAEGPYTQMFVHQPVAAVVPGSAPTGPPLTVLSPRRAGSGRRPPGRTLQQTNPYLRPELLPSRPVEARYEFRLQVAPSSNADSELRSTLVAFFSKIREYDSTLVIHPWADKDNTTQQSGSRRWRALARPEDIPATMDGLKRYFPRALPKPTGGFVYPSVHLGHTKTFAVLKTELAWWFQSERHGLWERQLQCESTSIVGWGLYSLQSIHIPELKRVLEEALGFPLGIRWRTIQTGQSGAIPPDQMAKALHFEVGRANKREAKRRLAELYARDATEFPLGIKMRLVWPLSDVMNLRTRAKVAALRLRQLQFCTHMRGMRSWELHSIDQPEESSQRTLRSRLMAIKSTTDGHQLFHSVDPSYVGEGAMQFAFHPSREEEARAMIIALIPYLRWSMAQECLDFTDVERERHFARTLYCHFSKDALDRAVGAVWNPATMSVDSPDDDYNGWVFDAGDSELDCSGFADDATPASTLGTSVTTSFVRPHDAAGDTDSVSTFPQGTSIASTVSAGSRSTVTRELHDPGPSATNITPASSLSSPSDPNQLASNLNSFVTSFQTMLASLPDNAQTQQLRAQLALLTASPSTDSSSPSAPPAATGQEP